MSDAALVILIRPRLGSKQSVVEKFKVAVFNFIMILITLPIALVVAWWSWAHFVQSPRFAETFFEDLLEIEDIVESRRWHWGSHPWGGRDLGCSYAIVNISKKVPLALPMDWEADWTETPVTTVPDGFDILAECTYLWSDKLVARLTRAHNKPGSYYSSTSETLLLYSPQEGVAARIRFGD